MRSLRSQELEVPGLKPFHNCKLDREKYAEVLTQIIENYSDGFVLSVNNKWGEGKTTFIRMWKVYLGNKGFKNIYFNAWEHDFGQDPMAAILSEIKSLNLGNKDQLDGIIKKAGKFSIQAIPILLKAVAEKYIDTKTFTEGIKELSQKAIDAFEEEVDEYAKKKKSLNDFKNALAEYVAVLDKPLVFIIDELDRCNPTYAVEVLEIIKHFFSVPGIIFVLSIDKEQLGNAVRGYYGSDRIDADEYLRRFIDLEYSLPSPKVGEFIRYLFEKSGINVFIKNPKRQNTYFDRNESDQFFSMANTFFMHNNSDLRSIEKILFHLSIVLKSFSPASRTLPEVLFILLYMKFKNQTIYGKIKNRNLNPDELLQVFHDFIPTELKVNSNIKLYGLEAMLLFLYSKSPNFGGDYNLWDGQGANEEVIYKSLFDSPDNKNFTQLLSTYRREGIDGIENLNFLINKIELTERFVE
jgi:hypothetical protein